MASIDYFLPGEGIPRLFWFSLAVSILILAGCSTATPRVAPSPTALPPTPTPEPPPTPTPLPQGIPLEPILTAPMIGPHSWSPDSTFLAYRTYSKEELEEYVHPDFPPGTLHFLNVQTGEVCQPPLNVESREWQNIAWLPDGRVMLIADGRLLVGIPCSQDFTDISSLFPVPIIGVATVNPERSLFVLTSYEGFFLYEPQSGNIRKLYESTPAYGGVSLSPGSTRAGITAELLPLDCEGRVCQMGTWVVDLESGAIEDIVYWKGIVDLPGDYGGPVWLSEDQFLIPHTADQGPLLATVGEGAVQIASEIFKLQPTEYCTGVQCETYLQGDGRAVDGMDNYHLILFGWGYLDQFPYIRLYHSEDGLIEVLPFRLSDGFSFDGRWLFLNRERGEDADTTTNQLWLRPVDPPESLPQLLISTPLYLYWDLSPDGTKLSIGAEFPTPSFRSIGLVYLFSLPEGEQIEIWSTGEDWSPFTALWSPDGKFLAVGAKQPSWTGGHRQENALFIIPLP